MKGYLLIALLILPIGISYAQSDNIKIKSNHLTESNYLEMDDFYLTHYLYIDLFLRENLYPDASVEDVSSILKAIKKYVAVESPLDIEIEKPGDRNYKIRVTVLKKDDGTELLIAFTNWSTEKGVFEEEIKIENDSYTRWYFLNGDKMTYRKDMSSENEPDMSKSDIANAYLFDELTENDSKIKNTIDEALKEKDLDATENIFSNLVLLKHLIFQRDIDGIGKQIEILEELFAINRSKSTLGVPRMAFKATKFQVELMK